MLNLLCPLFYTEFIQKLSEVYIKAMKLNKYELDYILKSVPEEIREDGLTCPA
jgi:hypothetical protein